jgi:hypothetical protein
LTQTKRAGRTELSVNEECDESAIYTGRVSDRYRESVRLSMLTNPEPVGVRGNGKSKALDCDLKLALT